MAANKNIIAQNLILWMLFYIRRVDVSCSANWPYQWPLASCSAADSCDLLRASWLCTSFFPCGFGGEFENKICKIKQQQQEVGKWKSVTYHFRSLMLCNVSLWFGVGAGGWTWSPWALSTEHGAQMNSRCLAPLSLRVRWRMRVPGWL